MVFNFRAVESWRGSISKYISYSFVRGIKIRWENKNKEWEWEKETEAQLKSARRTNFNAGEAYGLSLFLRRSIPTQKGSRHREARLFPDSHFLSFQEGIGSLKVVPGGIELRGQAAVLDALVASSLRSRRGKNLVLESWNNFTASARSHDGRLLARFTVGKSVTYPFSDVFSPFVIPSKCGSISFFPFFFFFAVKIMNER